MHLNLLQAAGSLHGIVFAFLLGIINVAASETSAMMAGAAAVAAGNSSSWSSGSTSIGGNNNGRFRWPHAGEVDRWANDLSDGLAACTHDRRGAALRWLSSIPGTSLGLEAVVQLAADGATCQEALRLTSRHETRVCISSRPSVYLIRGYTSGSRQSAAHSYASRSASRPRLRRKPRAADRLPVGKNVDGKTFFQAGFRAAHSSARWPRPPVAKLRSASSRGLASDACPQSHQSSLSQSVVFTAAGYSL